MSQFKLLGFLLCLLAISTTGGAGVTSTTANYNTEQPEPSSHEKENSSNEHSSNEQPEKLLLDHLLKDYERDIRPVLAKDGRKLSVKIGVHLRQINELDVKSHLLVAYVWIMLKWDDHILKWDPSEFSNITDIRVPVDRIWIPDLELYNSYDDEVSLSDGRTPLIVTHNGSVSWIEPKQLRSMCPTDVTYFPFDRHRCTLKIGSWSHDGFKLNLELSGNELDMHDFRNLGEWNLLESSLERSENIYSCCPEPYLDVTVTMVLERKSLHYVYNTLLPCLLLSILTVLILQLSPDNNLRLGVEILILLIFSFFMWTFTGYLPDLAKSTSLLLIYLVLMMMLTFASIMFTVGILKLHQAGNSLSASSLPVKLRMLLCMDETLETLNTRTKKGGRDNTSVDITFNQDDMPLTQYSFTESAIQREAVADNVQPSSSYCSSGHNYINKVTRGDCPDEARPSSSEATLEARKVSISTLTQQQSTIVPVEPNNTNIHSSCHDKTNSAAQWKLVAQKLDRIGFWCFALMTMLVNTCLLILSI